MVLLCIAAGAVIVAVATGLIEIDPSKFKAPRWVVGAVGGMFVIAGLVLAIGDRLLVLRGLLAALLLTFFSAVFDWVAFGPGERQFSGGFSMGGFGSGGVQGEIVGRSVFGVFAVPLNIWAAWLWFSWLRSRFGPRNSQ